MVAFNILAGRVSAPVLRLAQIWQDFHQARLSVARLGDILNTTPEPIYNSGHTALPTLRGEVIFEHVTFRYRIDGPEVLHDVSFRVPAGQIVGVVGPSGSGKSTLAKLVQRLYTPESGRVIVDGIDLNVVDPAWLRRQVGLVLQENVLSVARCATISRWPIRQCRLRGSWRQRKLPAPTSSSWNCRMATTPFWASAARACRAASASASPSRVPW